MIIANNATARMYVSDYKRQNNKLQTSMARLSSGMRFTSPGEAPADLGISERFRAQIRNSEEADRVIQNAMNMLQSTDSWMQEANNILDRLGELAVASADGSKSQLDRENLDLEFQQLKTEIARISESGKYNGLQVTGKTAVAVWDAVLKRIIFSQSDGTDERALNMDMRAGNTASNGVEYGFESSSGAVGDFVFTDDGKQLVYIAQESGSSGLVNTRQTLMKLELASNTLTTVELSAQGGLSATVQARVVMDEKGRIWVSNPDSGGAGYNINLLNITDMTLDAGGTASTNDWAGSAQAANGYSEFAVHGDSVYYIEQSGANYNYVKRNLYDTSGKEILLTDIANNNLYDFDPSETYAISSDGQYIAFEDENNAQAGTLVVLNAFSGRKVSLPVGDKSSSIVSLEFDANNRVYWTDTGGSDDENTIKRASIVFGEQPQIVNIETVTTKNAGHLGAINSALASANSLGLSLGGGSPATNYEFQVGPDSGMLQSFTTGDIRLTKLGISGLDVLNPTNAIKAIKATQKAIDIVANQRAIIGSQVSRLGFTLSANDGYNNNIAQAESRLRDVDFARESSGLVNSQIMSQASISVMSQANLARQAVLGLLQT